MRNIIIILIFLVPSACNYNNKESVAFFHSISTFGINQKFLEGSLKFFLFPSNYCSSCGENIIKKISETALKERWYIVVTGLTKAEVNYAATKFNTDLKIIKDYNGMVANSISVYKDKPLLIETHNKDIVSYKEY